METIPIFLSSDNNYAPFVATTIASICDNTKSFCNFYILDGGIKEENKNKILQLKKIFSNFEIEFIDINLEKEYANIDYKNNEYISISTYNRFLIPQLKPELKKVLYLDSDIVVLGDIKPLYETDMENYALGAAWDKSRILYNTDTFEPMELSKDYKYFNAGILLIDIQKWLKDNIKEKMFDILFKYKEKVLHADETLLNKYFDNNYKIFDIKYNYTDYDILNKPDSEIIIRHFASALKPWNANYTIIKKQVISLKGFDEFWKYAKMTEFYEEISIIYKKNINKNPLFKRFSIIADKQMKKQSVDIFIP